MGSGPIDSKIVMVGEAPGAEEERFGKPFIGTSGELLTRLMHQVGIARESCYITNVVKERPPGNNIEHFIKFDKKGVTASDAYLNYEKFLMEELSATNANVYVAIGGVSLYALTRMDKVTKRRGSILTGYVDGKQIKVIPIIHPASALRNYPFTHFIRFDLKRVLEESAYPEVRLPGRRLSVGPNFLESMAYLNSCHDLPLLGFDIEVVNEEVSCISVAKNPYDVISIPFYAEGRDHFTVDQEIAVWKELTSLLENPNIVKVGHNIAFDSTFLFIKYGIRTTNMKDTMILSSICYPDFPKGLDFVTSICTKEPYYKDDGKKWFRFGGSIYDFWIYNAKDSAVCIESLPVLEAEAQRQGNEATVERQTSILPSLVYMQGRGIKVDKVGMDKAAKEYEWRIGELQEELNKTAGQVLNANSSKQLIAYFYGTKGIKPYMNRATGNVSVDAMALKRMSKRGIEEAKIILEMRHLIKIKSTYFEMELDDDNRIRCSFNPVGTENGRLSSSKTIFGKGCVLPDTEVLTQEGWKRIDTLQPGEEVMQWSPLGQLTWCIPGIVKLPYEGDMVNFDSTYHHCSYTAEHRIPNWTSKKNLKVSAAKDLLQKEQFTIPISGIYSGHLKIPARILAMIQADGSIEGSNIRLSFQKKRKIERFMYLAGLYGLKYTEQNGKGNTRRFAILAESAKPYIEFFTLTGGKEIGSWVLWLDKDSIAELLDEIKYWDSTVRGRSFIFSTAKKNVAEWVATLAHLGGYSAFIRERNNNQGYGYFSEEELTLYTVGIKPRDYAHQERNMMSTSFYKGYVWCLQTPTSFFLIRKKGKIVVTGNSNMQNLPPEMLRFLVADPGCFLYNIDLSQAENRIVAYVSPEPNMISAFEQKIDIHRKTAGLIFGKPWEEISDEKGSASIGGGLRSERDWGKSANHGLNYDLSYRAAALIWEVPDNEAKYIVERYHAVYPGVRQMHAWVRAQLNKNRTLTNCLGRRRLFTSRWGDELFKEAYAFIPQSTVADVINERGLSFIMNNPMMKGVEILNQVHDSLVIQISYETVPVERHAECLKAIVNSLQTPLSFRGQTFSIPADTAVGLTLNKKSLKGVPVNGHETVQGLARELSRIHLEIRAAEDVSHMDSYLSDCCVYEEED